MLLLASVRVDEPVLFRPDDPEMTGAIVRFPPPTDCYDRVIEEYKKDVDRTLLRENLKLTVDERFRNFENFMRYVHELRAAGERSRNAR